MSRDNRKLLTQEAADLKAMIDHAFKGKPVDPEVSRRVRARADEIRSRLPLTDIAVDLIRASHEEI